MSVGSAQFSHADFGIAFQLLERLTKLVVHRPGHGVTRAGAIEGDPRQCTTLLKANGTVGGHAASHGDAPRARAANTVSVCSPNNGGARRTRPGVSLSLIGMPSVLTGPSTG